MLRALEATQGPPANKVPKGDKGDPGAAGVAGAPGPASDADAAVTIPVRELSPSGQASGQFGSATLTPRGNQTEVVVSITPGVAGTAQPAHIHTGNCASLGGVKHALTALDGGKSVTLVNATLASIRNGGTAINVHRSAAEVSVYVACGDIPLAPSLAIAINESNSSGQKGIATLTAIGNKTQVVVDVATVGLNEQPMHIHTGSCATLGGVKYPLANVFTGRSTTIVDVPFSSLRDGKFAINLHKSAAEVSAYTACGDIPSLNGFAGSGTVASNIQGFRLESFIVKAGTKVTWTNKDSVPHTVTSSAAIPVWDSGSLAKDAAFSYTFAQAGTFAFKCMTHPTTMLGIITVEQ